MSRTTPERRDDVAAAYCVLGVLVSVIAMVLTVVLWSAWGTFTVPVGIIGLILSFAAFIALLGMRRYVYAGLVAVSIVGVGVALGVFVGFLSSPSPQPLTL